jgi:hypothetical protein
MIILLALGGAVAAFLVLGLRNERAFHELWRDLAAGRLGRIERRVRQRMLSAIR